MKKQRNMLIMRAFGSWFGGVAMCYNFVVLPILAYNFKAIGPLRVLSTVLLFVFLAFLPGWLIGGGVGTYVKKHRISVWHFIDTAGRYMMLYGNPVGWLGVAVLFFWKRVGLPLYIVFCCARSVVCTSRAD